MYARAYEPSPVTLYVGPSGAVRARRSARRAPAPAPPMSSPLGPGGGASAPRMGGPDLFAAAIGSLATTIGGSVGGHQPGASDGLPHGASSASSGSQPASSGSQQGKQANTNPAAPQPKGTKRRLGVSSAAERRTPGKHTPVAVFKTVTERESPCPCVYVHAEKGAVNGEPGKNEELAVPVPLWPQ